MRRMLLRLAAPGAEKFAGMRRSAGLLTGSETARHAKRCTPTEVTWQADKASFCGEGTSAKRKGKCLNSGIEEFNLESSVLHPALLLDELVEAVLAPRPRHLHRYRSAVTSGRLVIQRHAKADGLPAFPGPSTRWRSRAGTGNYLPAGRTRILALRAPTVQDPANPIGSMQGLRRA